MEFYEDLKKTKIFSLASEFECQAMMFCLKTRFRVYKKNEHIIQQGQALEDVVLIVKGSAIVEHIDSFGDISILMRLKDGELFGVESAYNKECEHKDSLIATEKTLVMFMNKHRLLTPCENRCRRHENVIKFVAESMAESNLKLMNKLAHMRKKTTREKLLSYFTSLSKANGSNYFELPFNKTELANYLSVDRSAMSNELSKMKEEGLIEFDKRQFHLKK